jgi:hypothetical protein
MENGREESIGILDLKNSHGYLTALRDESITSKFGDGI